MRNPQVQLQRASRPPKASVMPAPRRSQPPPPPDRFHAPLTTERHLTFLNPGTLGNALGDKFNVSMAFFNKQEFFRLTLESRDRPEGQKLTITVIFLAFKDENKVKITGISTVSEAHPDTHKFEKPSDENRGFGVMRIAMQFAKAFAEKHGITRIAVTPANNQLKKYYKETWGFQTPEINEHGVETELHFYLKD